MPSYEDLLEEARRHLEEFGVQELPGRLVLRGDSLWLTTAPEVPEDVRVHSVGVRLFRIQNHGLKPTSFGLMLLGARIKKRRVELTRAEVQELLSGRTLRRPGLPQGYVALCLEGEALGCGEVRGESLRGQIPLGRRQELLIALAQEGKVLPKPSQYNDGKGAGMKTQEDVLKGAILFEERGRIFYEHAAQEAKSPGVREVFALLAQEEGRHRDYLAKMLAGLLRTGKMEKFSRPASDMVSAVLTEDVKKGIEAAGFEAAAIYAGMALEERAVAYYRENAKKAPPNLAELFEFLAQWEQTHWDLLFALDEELRQRIWHERGFWPLD